MASYDDKSTGISTLRLLDMKLKTPAHIGSSMDAKASGVTESLV